MSMFVTDIDEDLSDMLSSLGPLKERRGGGGSVADSALSKEVVETQGMYELSTESVEEFTLAKLSKEKSDAH